MALLPEELHKYNQSGLIGRADLMTEIKIPILKYILPTKILQALQELRWEIDGAIRAEGNAMKMAGVLLRQAAGDTSGFP